MKKLINNDNLLKINKTNSKKSDIFYEINTKKFLQILEF